MSPYLAIAAAAIALLMGGCDDRKPPEKSWKVVCFIDGARREFRDLEPGQVRMNDDGTKIVGPKYRTSLGAPVIAQFSPGVPCELEKVTP